MASPSAGTNQQQQQQQGQPPPSAQASRASLASRGSSLPPLPRGAATTAWLAAPAASSSPSGAASAPLTTLSYVPGTDPAPAELLGDFQEALYLNASPQQTTSRLLRLGAGTPAPGTGRFTRRAQSPNLGAGSGAVAGGGGGAGSPVAGGGGGGALSGGTNPAAHVRASSTPNGQGIPLPGFGPGGGGGGAATARAVSPGLRAMSPPPPPLNPAALAAAFPGVPGGALDTAGLNLDGSSGRTPEAVAAVSSRVQAAWSALGPGPSSLAAASPPPSVGRAGQGGGGASGGWVGAGEAGGGGRPGSTAPGHGGGRHGGGGAGAGGGGREQGAMLEDARRLAAQAAEVLYGSELEVSAADRAAAALALQQLEGLLGAKEVSAAALGQAARSLKTDVGRELHFSEKQMSFAAAQIKVLDRQQDRLRQQYNPRLPQAPHPPPLPLPDPTAAAAAHADGLDGGDGGGDGGSAGEGPESPTMRYGLMGGGGGRQAGGPGGVLDGGVSAGNWWPGGGGAAAADAMERTLQLRALSRAEAALAGVAAARAAAERPRSGEAGEGPGGADVEELKALKHMAGSPGAGDAPLSYLGVNVRRAPTPLPGGEAAAAASFMRGAGAGGAAAGGGPAPVWDPNSTLQWSNRGISTQKMLLLREVLSQSPRLVRLCLGGNKLCNEDVMELMLLLSEPAAPRVTELDLEQNTHLSWRCALPLAMALGMASDATSAVAADWAAVAAAMPAGSAAGPASVVLPASVPTAREKIRRLPLQRLGLSGVKLGDKGVAQLAEGLRANSSLLELDLRRCGLTDVGGSVLFEVLGSNITLQRLDCSWNTLRSESGRVLEVALAGNAGLRELGLAHNGLADVDGARVLKGLLSHGKWLRADLTHNNLGPGACMMAAELFRHMGDAAAGLVRQGGYAEAWGPGGGAGGGAAAAGSPRRLQTLASQRSGFMRPLGGGEGTLDGPERSSTSVCASPTGRSGGGTHLGAQLGVGQPALLLDGNPLGNTGLRILLDGLDAMSRAVADAAGLPPPSAFSLDGSPPGLPPSPLALSIAHCNVAPPSDRSAGAGQGQGEEVNPFLPSIAVLCRPEGAAGGGGGGGGKDGKDGKKKAAAASKSGKEGKDAKGKGKGGKGAGGDDGGGGRPPVALLTLQSPHLDLQSPAGMYSLDLAHPGTSALVSYFLRLRQRLEAAVASGAAHGVSLSLVDIAVNGRPVKADALAGLVAGWSEGRLELTVRAPAQLAVEPPAPLSAAVVEWLAGLMADPAASPLWKLAVVQAAGAGCYFTPGQCGALLGGFDPQSAECVAAAQMLYARSVQPLAFWQRVLPAFSPPQQEALRAMVGDLVALDLGCPMGRYALNLSRQVDRFVALRLQLASALEASWLDNKYYINWLNASLNGQPLDTAGLTRIRDYAMPGAGVLRLDYVSYRKPRPEVAPASRDELAELQAMLRGVNIAHIAAGLAVRQIADPPPPPPKQEPPRSAHASRRKQQAPAAPPKPKARLSALQLLRTPLGAVALLLAKPATPPLPQPDANGVVLPPPPPPASWVAACGFSPAHLFRRTGTVLPECSFSGFDVPPRASTDGERPVSAKTHSLGRRSTRDGGGAADRASGAGGGGGPEKGAVGGKGGKGGKGDKGRRKSGTGGKDDGHADDGAAWQRARAEHHAALLLAVHQSADLPLLACKLGAAHLAAAVGAILREPGGPRAAAALLAALPPPTAIKFLWDQADPSPCLLPPELRKTLLGMLPLAPERIRCYEAAARAASEASLQRTRRVRTALNMWAAERYLSAEQLTAILGTLYYESDRITAMVVLWPRVVRGGWKKTYERLTPAEQRQVMMRLGYWHVYSCLADPHGIAFALDLAQPEQKDIARELVRAAVKETMRARQDAKARGGGGAAGNIQTLLELHGNGNPVSIPEDEKLWTMAESNFRTLDFLYSPTFEQSLAQVTASTIKIQRFWQGVRARRQAGPLPSPSPSALAGTESTEASAEPSSFAWQ
ncbi:hypothetical protein HXX76_008629 [Chlamydomonas incerta]|uniref:Uncharacterized protein n=1 Tax=Chlamydomonas incerta TaxID=51695 RepID=A0A835W0P7_CHLIN|nr:hypothetical protein HXX76_008629 [Chlamydomonas incerta]|eukprot:KAG2432898.1 hypothetical protein HXX76_008629 [Chlamydomonas incerta]